MRIFPSNHFFALVQRLVWGVVLCLSMASAYAQIAFGTMRSNVYMGQPFSATIEVFVDPFDLQTLRGRSYRVRPGGVIEPTITTRIITGPDGAIVQLGSTVPINDPVVDIVVELVSGSGAAISRSYTVLVNPGANANYPQQQAPFSFQNPNRATRGLSEDYPQYSRIKRVPRVSSKPPKNNGAVGSIAPLDNKEGLEQQLAMAKSELSKLEALVAKSATGSNAPPPQSSPSEPSNKAPTHTANSAGASPHLDNAPKKLDPVGQAKDVADKVLNNAKGKADEAMATLKGGINTLLPSGDSKVGANPPAANNMPNQSPITTALPSLSIPSAPIAEVTATPSVPSSVAALQASPPPPPPPPVIDTKASVAKVPAPAISKSPPPAQAKKTAEIFGISLSFLPEGIGLTELMIGGGALLALIAGVMGFGIIRKRKFAHADDEEDDMANVNFGDIADFSSITGEQPSNNDNTSLPPEPEESHSDNAEDKKPKKKKSLLSKLRRKEKDESASSENADNAPMVDFGALDNPGGKAQVSESKNESKIERFVEDQKDKDDDFTKDLQQLVGIKTNNASEHSPTMLMETNKQDSGNDSLSPAPTQLVQPQSANDGVVNFSDEITRIQPPEEADDLLSTSMSEMLSEDFGMPSPEPVARSDSSSQTKTSATRQPISDDTFSGTTKSGKLIEESSTALSMDDLDFSSEKTMIMPSLKDIAQNSHPEEDNPRSGEDNDLFEFKLDLGAKAPTATKPTPNTAVPNISNDATAFSPKIDAPSLPIMQSSAPTTATTNAPVVPTPLSLPDFELPVIAANTKTSIALPKDPVPPMLDLSALEAMDIPVATSAEKKPPVAKGDSMGGIKLPNFDDNPLISSGVPNINISNAADTINEPAKKAKEATTKAPVMIDLAALDLSSLKLD